MMELGRVSHTHLRKHGMTIEQYRSTFPDARMAFHPQSQRDKVSGNAERAEKIRLKKLEYWSTRKGKTIEELRGKESADRTKARLSSKLSGSDNPAYGKTYEGHGGRNVGRYRGFLFRSLYEYSFLKFLESIGQDLTRDVMYEQHCIPFEFQGTQRTYRPDFEVHDMGVIEVKSVYETTIGPARPLNEAKFAAARAHFASLGQKFTVMTERDFPVFTKVQAKMDPEVTWIRS
jgi:hypothetical protein